MKMNFLSKIFRKSKNADRRQRSNCDEESFNRLEKESLVTEKSIEDVNYGLGFNDVDLSDRVLHLEIKHSRNSSKTTDLEIEPLKVCLPKLAAKSPFFYKMFKNNAEFTVIINASEKAAFLDLLNSIYDRPLTASSRDELMDVMMAADKFEVTSCARHCVRMLIELHMTIESALSYLMFPTTLHVVGEETRPLVDAAKQHLSSHFSGFTKLQQEGAMNLPLCGIEAVVGADDFEVKSEEELLDFMLKWVRKNYSDLEVRRDILTNRLLGLICLPCLSYSKLMEMVDYHDCDSAQVAKLVLKALSYKIELPHGPNSIPTVHEALLSNNAILNSSFPRRAYNNRRLVFFDIRKEDCVALAPYSMIYSEAFYLGGRRFSLFVKRYEKEGISTNIFGLFIEMGGSGSCTLKYEFSAMRKPSYKFETLFTANASTFTETSTARGCIFSRLIGEDDNDHIIGGFIHIQAQLTLKVSITKHV